MSPPATKQPALTVAFWVMKIAATTLGVVQTRRLARPLTEN